jgi:5-methyltetrahydropteroyltriglutamate--homocysteine methyltransferase
LQRQREIGLAVVTDGEFRRDAWMSDVSDALDGFAASYPVRATTLPDGSVIDVAYHSKPIVGKLRQRRRIAAHEAEFLAAHAGAPFKITIPSPNAIGVVAGEDDAPTFYASREELLADLILIYQDELRALAGEGVPYVQLDQTLGRFSTEQARAALVSAGEDPAEAIAREVAVDNACFDAIAGTGVTTAKHFCRGSRTRSRGEGDYEWFGEHVFSELHVDRFLLEYDSEVVGGFEPLRYLPKGKVAVLGLVTSKYAELESQDELLRRIEEAARYCPVEQLAISPQCGFGGSAENNFMSVDEQWRKLDNMVQVADRVWG